jgi:hypothetical protein
MQHYVTPLPLGALLAAHAACLAAAFSIFRSRTPAFPGWHVLTPSGTHWFCFLGSWAFGTLISWVWLFVGSRRSDAGFQMNVALLLAVVFCTAGASSGIYIAALRRKALRWRGDVICWRERRQEMRQGFSRFEAIRRGWDGSFHIRFTDQSILKLDLYARNASEFLARFSEEIGEDVY